MCGQSLLRVAIATLLVWPQVLMLPHNAIAETGKNLSDYHGWIMEKMEKWSPPGKAFIPDAQESLEEAQARYEQISKDLMDVVFDPSEPPLFDNKYGRSQTMAVLLSVAWWESRYRRDIDLNVGKLARGDHGASWCMMQVMLGQPAQGTRGDTPKRIVMKPNGLYEMTSDKDRGWSGGDLIQDRKKCFRAGLHMIRNSFHACSGLPVLDRLSVYTSGDCHLNQPQSRTRMGSAIQWLSYQAPPLTDSQLSVLTVPSVDPNVGRRRFVGPVAPPVVRSEKRAKNGSLAPIFRAN